MPSRREGQAVRVSTQGAVWSAGLVAETALHPISVRLYADAPYAHELYRPDVLQRIVHPANATVCNFSQPLRLSSTERRWYLPGSAADLLLHTSCVASCYPAIISHLSPLTDASDVAPPHIAELAAGSFGFHRKMMNYWAHLESETRGHLDAGFTYILIADVFRCIQSMSASRMVALLEDAHACTDAIRILKAMHGTWQAAGCHGLPLTAGFLVLIKLYMKDVDDRLRAEGITFLRLQDDFRLFCRSEQEARHALAILSEALTACGLALNSNKTMLLSRTQLRYSWRKRGLDWKRTLSRGFGYPLLSDSLRFAPFRGPSIRLLRLLYGSRWTAD